MMTELVDEQIRGPLAVCGSGAKESVNTSTAVDLGVGQYFDEVVGR